VTSGCFHREPSPRAYGLIDKNLASLPRDGSQVEILEHESGPELLITLALVTAGFGLTKSVIDLIVALLGARREGIRGGDKPSEPLELILRRFDDRGTLREETCMRINHRDSIDRSEIETLLNCPIRATDHCPSERIAQGADSGGSS
jgi:hypothetical protein